MLFNNLGNILQCECGNVTLLIQYADSTLSAAMSNCVTERMLTTGTHTDSHAHMCGHRHTHTHQMIFE